MNPFSLESKTILVTGASSGIGRATAKLCAELGAKVILLGRNSAALEETQRQMLGGKHPVIQFDLLAFDELPAMMQSIAEVHGPLTGLVHCAGMHMAKPLRSLTANNLDEIIKVNVTTGILLAKAFRHKLISLRPASLVFLSSVVAKVGQSSILPYALTKGAMLTAVKSLAVELASENIRVNAVAPGVVNTPMSEKLFEKIGAAQVENLRNVHLLGLGEPYDVACSIVFLLSPAARWITGSCLTVDGGYTAI